MAPYTYEYPRPALTVDTVLLTIHPPVGGAPKSDRRELRVLLIKRKLEPRAGWWAVPGGFVEIDERLDEAARRELAEETNISGVKLLPIGAFDEPHRDPRGRVISHAYMGVVRRPPAGAHAADDAEEIGWHSAHRPPRLAFDHNLIVRAGVAKLQDASQRSAIVFQFLRRQFTIREARQAYEAILNRGLDAAAFRRRLLASGWVLPAEKAGATKRGARRYRLNRKARVRYLRLPEG